MPDEDPGPGRGRPSLLPVLDQQPGERADAARNRQRILRAATQMLAERGAGALSLDEVARRAGVGVGTVYRRFGDRSGLIAALVDEREIRFQHAFLSGPPPLGPGAPAAQRLRAFLHALLERFEEQRDLLVAGELSSRTGWYVTAPYGLRHIHVVALLGEALPGADAHYLADVLLSALSPTLVNHQREVRGFTLDRIRAGLDDLLAGLLGVTPDPPPHG